MVMVLLLEINGVALLCSFFFCVRPCFLAQFLGEKQKTYSKSQCNSYLGSHLDSFFYHA
jgi:hypothetical protein